MADILVLNGDVMWEGKETEELFYVELEKD